jgi:lipopolysaccharide/colanic/teichoic acid biosynthesis glycosyltransferase
MYYGATDIPKERNLRNYGLDGIAFEINNDPRVTSSGFFLRSHHLDELPELWNVLKGEMSLVGPRPLEPKHVKIIEQKYQQKYHRRFSVKPGLTCLWQVRGRFKVGFEEWMRLDLDSVVSQR